MSGEERLRNPHVADLPSGQDQGYARGQHPIGLTTRFCKTVGEFDIYQFAGLSGDFGPNHINAEYMRDTPYGERIAHGALLVAYMSACSAALVDRIGAGPMVTYGYDRIRFTAPVFIGDTITVELTVVKYDQQDKKAWSNVTAHNQQAAVVAVASHILKGV